MIRAAIAFFVLAIVAYVLGAAGIAGLSMEIGKILVGVFIVLAILSYIGSLLSGSGKKTGRLP